VLELTFTFLFLSREGELEGERKVGVFVSCSSPRKMDWRGEKKVGVSGDGF